MDTRKLFLTAGISYLVIFVCAIFANFVVVEGVWSAPLEMIQDRSMLVRLWILAFLIAALCDVIVAWVLRELYSEHPLTTLSTYFRVLHATVFGVSVFALVEMLRLETEQEILASLSVFNDIWLIGLFFFGVHLIVLPRIIKLPRLITWMLPIAWVMYMVDTGAHFVLENYQSYADIFLALVAIPSILGEMAFSIWLLFQKKV